MPPPGGVMVEFRDEDTDELLWTAPMNSVPQEDDAVSYAVIGGSPTEYKVEGVTYQFRAASPLVGENAVAHCQHTPVCTVSVV